MRCTVSTLALVLAAALCCSPASADVVCSSINGPFCTSISSDGNSGAFGAAVAPRHAAAFLDQNCDVRAASSVYVCVCVCLPLELTLRCLLLQAKEQLQITKRTHIERVLKQYELEAALDDASDLLDHDSHDDMIDMLLDDTAALFITDEEDDMDGEYEESPVVGTFAFNNEGGVFEELDRMDGADLKVRCVTHSLAQSPLVSGSHALLSCSAGVL